MSLIVSLFSKHANIINLKQRTNMTWFILSLSSAFFSASLSAWLKKHFSDLSHFELAICPLFFSIPPLLIIYLLIPKPEFQIEYWYSLLKLLPFQIVGFFCQMIAIHISPLSLTMPFLAFTPAFVMITGAFFLNESLNTWGIMGIVSIIAGAYILHINPKDRRMLTTISSMFTNIGSMIMLLAAFCYGFAAVFGKKAILCSSPLYMGMHFFILFNGLMTIVFICCGKIRIKQLLQRYPQGIIAGLAMFGEILSHCLGVSIAKVAYFVSVKRMNIIISIVYAGLLFKEENLIVRSVGATFMVIGAFVILIFGN